VAVQVALVGEPGRDRGRRDRLAGLEPTTGRLQAIGELQGVRRQPHPLADEPDQAELADAGGGRERVEGVIFITHNPHHAYPVGDRFVVLNRGQSIGSCRKDEIDQAELVRLMAGGRELTELEHELATIKAEVG
jgi:hypothetical protein